MDPFGKQSCTSLKVCEFIQSQQTEYVIGKTAVSAFEFSLTIVQGLGNFVSEINNHKTEVI